MKFVAFLLLKLAVAGGLCQHQLEDREVPIACFAKINKIKNQEHRQIFSDILERRCAAAVNEESRVERLVILEKHPILSAQCRKVVSTRLLKIIYRNEDDAPEEIVKVLSNDGTLFE